ncbi:hypothetical protein NL676_039631 [Syzygium grande]|nr:hypothetical protein NL676_039631 [Syzygium grande]
MAAYAETAVPSRFDPPSPSDIMPKASVISQDESLAAHEHRSLDLFPCLPFLSRDDARHVRSRVAMRRMIRIRLRLTPFFFLGFA